MDIAKKFDELKSEKHRVFMEGIVPGIDGILGVPSDEIRKIAKEVYKEKGYDFLNEFYIGKSKDIYEFSILQGFVIGLNIKDLDKAIYQVERFVPTIDNWAVCDSFCSSLKIVKKNKDKFFYLIEKYLNSKEEYEVRFALVLLLTHYVDDNYLERALLIFSQVKRDEYYIQMALAWAISKFFFKYPKEVFKYLKESNLQRDVYKKTFQKIIDSKQVSIEDKNRIKELRKEKGDTI